MAEYLSHQSRHTRCQCMNHFFPMSTSSSSETIEKTDNFIFCRLFVLRVGSLMSATTRLSCLETVLRGGESDSELVACLLKVMYNGKFCGDLRILAKSAEGFVFRSKRLCNGPIGSTAGIVLFLVEDLLFPLDGIVFAF